MRERERERERTDIFDVCSHEAPEHGVRLDVVRLKLEGDCSHSSLLELHQACDVILLGGEGEGEGEEGRHSWYMHCIA